MQTQKTPRMLATGEQDWVADFFADTDALDIDRLAPWFTEDLEVRFGNEPTIVGKAAALECLAGFWRTIKGMEHSRHQLVKQEEMAVLMSTVTYTRLDDSKVSLPVASYLRQAGPRTVDRLWVFIDLSPLYATLA